MPVRSAHGTPGLHDSYCDPRASPLLFLAVPFSLSCLFFASIASSELPLSLLHPKPKPPLFVLFRSHTKALFLLFPNSVKSFIHLFFRILAYFVIYFLRCDAHSFGLMCPHLRIPDLESWNPSFLHTKITSVLPFSIPPPFFLQHKWSRIHQRVILSRRLSAPRKTLPNPLHKLC